MPSKDIALKVAQPGRDERARRAPPSLERFHAAAEAALDAIAAPAFVVARSGEVLLSNDRAYGLMTRDRARLARSLGGALAGAPEGAGWELRPLGDAGREIGFLAIMRSTRA